MEKKEVIGRLSAMLNALNTISVSGKANVLNLGGCIALTEEIIQGLSKEEEEKKEEPKEEEK
ncbi:MAG: hypothetical protein PHR82_06650 [Endomicrobiaceae bacterium]|nr:hypothetical protein [Endomicrobiaceae bacterium]